eukprot:GHUV01010201.1.p1 GENE.GHUV01010201.1~~GHUV01010201.1.p1  ORF type:complete len:208 (+),score=43.50 GHUV01010201.1:702-1325(+)
MSLQQASRTLLQVCSRSWPAHGATMELYKHQRTLLTAAGRLSAALIAQQHAAVAGHWPPSSLRTFADAPAPADPMIIPLRNQPAPQQSQPTGPPDRNRGPWEKVQDQASGGTYWWNTRTGVTTPVGAPKPDAWAEVPDKESGLVYYWNQESGDTTSVGEPMPGPEGRIVTAAQGMQEQRPGLGAVLVNSLAVGFGVGLVFALIRMVF